MLGRQSNKTWTRDGGGDTHAIAQMVKYAIDKYKANPDRVYATGDSSGGMMTELLLGALSRCLQGRLRVRGDAGRLPRPNEIRQRRRIQRRVRRRLGHAHRAAMGRHRAHARARVLGTSPARAALSRRRRHDHQLQEPHRSHQGMDQCSGPEHEPDVDGHGRDAGDPPGDAADDGRIRAATWCSTPSRRSAAITARPMHCSSRSTSSRSWVSTRREPSIPRCSSVAPAARAAPAPAGGGGGGAGGAAARAAAPALEPGALREGVARVEPSAEAATAAVVPAGAAAMAVPPATAGPAAPLARRDKRALREAAATAVPPQPAGALVAPTADPGLAVPAAARVRAEAPAPAARRAAAVPVAARRTTSILDPAGAVARSAIRIPTNVSTFPSSRWGWRSRAWPALVGAEF